MAYNTAMYVPPDTPVFIRHRDSGDIEVEKMERLLRHSKWEKGEEEGTSFATLLDMDAWGKHGWMKIQKAYRKFVKSETLLRVIHPCGCVWTSSDEGVDICPTLPPFPELASDYVCKQDDVRAFRDLYAAQEEYSRLLALNYPVTFSIDEETFQLYLDSTGSSPASSPRSMPSVTSSDKPYDGYLYTFELEDGSEFQAGFGSLSVRGRVGSPYLNLN